MTESSSISSVFSSHVTIGVLSFTEAAKEVGLELSGIEILEYGVAKKDSSVPNHLMSPLAMTTIISAAAMAWETGKGNVRKITLFFQDHSAYSMHTALRSKKIFHAYSLIV